MQHEYGCIVLTSKSKDWDFSLYLYQLSVSASFYQSHVSPLRLSEQLFICSKFFVTIDSMLQPLASAEFLVGKNKSKKMRFRVSCCNAKNIQYKFYIYERKIQFF